MPRSKYQKGQTRMDHIENTNECPDCDGWGWLESNVSKVCPKCGGTGVLKVDE